MILSSKRGRNEFTAKEDSYLAHYIARCCPENKGRSGNKIYQTLVENVRTTAFLSLFPSLIFPRQSQNLWPWCRTHTAHSWRERYVQRKDEFDRQIEKLQANHFPAAEYANLGPRTSYGTYDNATIPSGYTRQQFTTTDDDLLVQYLAMVTPDGARRKGNAVYQRLVSQVRNKYILKNPYLLDM